MSKILLTILFLLTLVTMSACAGQPKPNNPVDAVENIGSLTGFLDTLREDGATVELGDQVSQPFFDPKAQIVSVNGQDVQVFVFPDITSREAAQATISPDGTSIGTSMVSWIDTPHFWGKGALIVLYIGSDAATIKLLDNVLN